MHRKTYIYIIACAFSIAYIPDVLSIIFQERILIDYIDRQKIKLFLCIYICFMESTLIKKDVPGVIGWILSLALIFTFFISFMHWPYGIQAMIIIILSLLALWTYYAIKEKNKNILNYLLWVFIIHKLLGFLTSNHNPVIWWSDRVIGISITVVAIYLCLRPVIKRKINK